MTPITVLANRIATPVKWVSIGLMVAAILVLIRALPFDRVVDSLIARIETLGVWGPVALAGVYVVATVLLLPGSVLTLAAGAVFGLVEGTIAVSIGSTTGAAAAFLAGRYLAREKVARMAKQYPTFDAIDQAISEGGWKIVALLRLSPAVPFNLQNYLYGLTAIRFWPCVLASWIFMLPGTFMYVYLGYIARAGIEGAAAPGGSSTVAQWSLRMVGLLATVVVTIYITKLATRAVKQRTRITGPAPEEQSMTANEGASVPPRGWPRGATVMAIIAIVAVSAAAYARANADALTRFVGSMLGPPAVAMQESYEPIDDGPAFDHSTFDALLRAHVDDAGRVDYAGLKAQSTRLDQYIASLADAPFDRLGRDEKLALLINAYNAFTLRLILDHQPLESIKDIPASRRWSARRWNVAGNVWSLDQIEHEQIRPRFAEPRIHFALVCAAAGCPVLRQEAYVAARLEEQLHAQAIYAHTHDRWFRFDDEAGVVHLTKLYDWYGGDFRQVAGSELAYAARYVPELKSALDAGRTPRIRWLDYDWSLNGQDRP
ncbi:MAG: VTT domain-containing protein [Planctomycetota bacterium]|jgi:uncharacterized membrane protein YdjX (TVP38/TMEM64 family)